MQPYIINDARRVAEKIGQDVIAFEYEIDSRLGVYRQHGIETVENFEWWAKHFRILHSMVISPRD